MQRVVGLGSDLLRIERIARLGARGGQKLLDRLLAPEEQGVAVDWPRIAGLFAAKEAFFKALGTGLVQPLRWVEVAVLGSDALSLSGASAAAFAALGGVETRLTMSRAPGFVLATVLLLGEVSDGG